MNKVTADEMRAVPQSRVMSIDFLFDDFDRLIQSPESVHRLRRFILDLAVRGKLLPQDPNDEPASELVKRIAAEKARLVKAGKIRKGKVLPIIKIDEALFRIPAKWRWVRFGSIADFSAGRTPTRNEPSFWNTGDYPWISIADMNDGETLTTTRETVSEKSAKQVFRSDPERVGTMIMSFKLTIGKIARLGIRAYHNEAIISIRLYVVEFDPYLFKALPFFAKQGDTKGAIKGATLNRESISNIPIPLPPLAEQHRIVAKVDELMAVCDRLEAARAEREATRDRLATASLVRLNAPDRDPSRFQHDVAFVLKNLVSLTTRPDQIKALRQTILNLAVRGKLVPQDPNDDPTSELLKRKKIPVRRTGLFELPESWAWVNVGAVADSRLGKMLDKSKNKGTPHKYLRNINVRWFEFDLSDLMEMRFEDSELPEFALRDGDVLICEGGEPGRAAVWDACETDIYFQKAIHRVRFLNLVDSDYFVRALRASADDGRLAENFTGTGIKHLTGKGLAAYLFPLPPLAEQHRIVAKVDELMFLCDRLEASLDTGDNTCGRLVEAVHHKLLSGDKINASLPGVGVCRNRGEND